MFWQLREKTTPCLDSVYFVDNILLATTCPVLRLAVEGPLQDTWKSRYLLGKEGTCGYAREHMCSSQAWVSMTGFLSSLGMKPMGDDHLAFQA